MLNKIPLPIFTFARAAKQHYLLVRGDWLSLVIWPALGLLAITTLWIFYQARWHQEESTVRTETLQMVSAASRSYALQITRSLDGLDTLMQYIANDLANHTHPINLANLRVHGVFNSRPFVIVAVIGEDGLTRTTTLSQNLKVSALDRDYFQFHKLHQTNVLRIGQPVLGRISKKSLIQVTRRLNKKRW